MATYQGAQFEAGIGPTDGEIVLFAACPPPEELGFEPATGHWRKQLRLADVDAVWQSRPVGVFRGERCIVLDDLGDRLHIGYLGHDGYQAEQLGYWQVDRGVFELVAPRAEVSDILEERTEYPRPAEPPGWAAGNAAAPSPAPGTAEPGSVAYTRPPEATSGQYPTPGFGRGDVSGSLSPAAPSYLPVPDGTTGVALPLAVEPPLPLEAEALRAASASRRTRPQPPPAAPPPADGARPSRQHRAARRRMATELLFADLANLAGIPAGSYAVGEDVEGAMCLIETGGGFEVFHCAGGARHELQVFASEESACFYLFGVLAAEAVRNGTLGRQAGARIN